MTRPDQTGRAMGVAIASFIALLFSGAPLLTYTQSLFIGPMTTELGWTKAQYFMPLALSGAAAALLVPFIGKVADRYGLRLVLIPGVALFALAYGALGLVGSRLEYGLLLLAVTVFQSAHGVLLYAKAVALWPSRRPALSFSIALSGAAAGGIIVPPIAAALIAHVGWHEARYYLAALVLLVSLPVAAIFVRGPSVSDTVATAGPDIAASGMTMRAALRTRAFWCVMAVVGLSGASINAMVANLVPILSGQGFSAALAAAGLSVIATSQLIGRLLSGLLIDKVATPLIALPLLLCPLAGILLLGMHPWMPLAFMAVALLGLGLGAEMEMAAFFTRRYFGALSFAQIYGCMLMLYILGANAGPLLLGAALDSAGGATGALIAAGALLVPSLAALLLLPAYPAETA